MRRLAALAALCLMVAAPASAVADGDPASDVLLGQDVFLPYSPISPTVQHELYAVTAAARRAGYPVKVALIGARSDLGVVPALFGRPAAYARFLSAELAGVAGGPVLVVMPGGFGLAASGRALGAAALRGIAIGGGGGLGSGAGAGADGLGEAAVASVARLAARAGHPLPAGAATGGGSLGASAGTVAHAELAIAVMAALAAAAIAAALRLRRAAART
jgi:hypothetical protein